MRDPVSDEVSLCRVCEPVVPGFSKPGTMNRGGKAPIMIIGQGPGKREVEEDRPFAGAAGRRLDEWLVSSGAPPDDPRADTYLTSVIKCAFDPFSQATFRRMAVSCRRFLATQFEYVQPRLVITLGRYAYESVTVVGGKYNAAVNQPIDTRDHVLVTDFGLHFVHLPWPHPSGLNRMLNNPAIVNSLAATFPLVADARGASK